VDNLDPPAISAAATAQNWKIWRDVHSDPVSLGSRKYSAIRPQATRAQRHFP
jgi:hypothetical protein